MSEVIELMAAFPGRDFRFVEVTRYVGRGATLSVREVSAMRKAVQRALEALASAGVVLVRPPRAGSGGYALYRWRSDTATRHVAAPTPLQVGQHQQQEATV